MDTNMMKLKIQDNDNFFESNNVKLKIRMVQIQPDFALRDWQVNDSQCNFH